MSRRSLLLLLLFGLSFSLSALTTHAQHPAAAGQEAGPSEAVLAPGDARLHLEAVTAPSTRAWALYLERDGQRRRFGTLTETVTVTPEGTWRRVQHLQTPQAAQTDSLTASTDLAPRSHFSRNPGRVVDLRFADGAVTGTYQTTGADADSVQDALPAPAFDANVIDLVARAVPLEAGFEAPVRTYERASAEAAEETTVSYTVRVERLESDGQVAVVSYTKGDRGARLFVDVATRALHKMEVEAGPGMLLVMLPDAAE